MFRKMQALMIIIEMFIARHERGLIKLDEPSFKLFEIAKRIRRAEDGDELESAFKDLSEFRQ